MMGIQIEGPQDIRRLAMRLEHFDSRAAFEDCAIMFEKSTQVGFIKRVSPEGIPWPANPDWWVKMKGNSTPLTGITAGGVSEPSPPWVAKGNKEHMRNSLVHTVSKNRAVVTYKRSVRLRAAINQEGGVHAMQVYHYLKPSIKIYWNVDVQQREHLGIAEFFHRLHGKTDPEHFEEAFLARINKALGRSMA